MPLLATVSSMVSMHKLLFLLGLLAALPASAGEFYCCPDPATGRRICEDTVPPQCRGRGYKVLDSAGNLLRDVPPPLTPEQKAQQAQEAKLRKQQEEAAREQRRKDQALLDTYATPADIDQAQQKAENDLNTAISSAKAQMDTIRRQLQKLEKEAEFYKKKTMPTELAKDLEAQRHEMSLLQELVNLKQKDFDTVRTKYDADRKRYFELTGRSSGTSSQPRPR